MLGVGSSISSGSSIFRGPAVNTSTNTSAMHFDGTGDYLSLADNDDFSFDGGVPWSVAAWVKRDSGSSTDGFFHKGPGPSYASNLVGNEYRVFWTGGKMYIDVGDGSYQNSANYKRVIFDDNSSSWQHYVIASDGTSGSNIAGKINLYINGSKQTYSNAGGSDTDGLTNTSSNFEIGRANQSDKQLGGEVCQFMMWRNKELAASEAAYLYASGAAHRDPTQDGGDYGSSSNLLLWLPLQSNANDSSSNGHNMTANGDAAVSSSTVPF